MYQYPYSHTRIWSLAPAEEYPTLHLPVAHFEGPDAGRAADCYTGASHLATFFIRRAVDCRGIDDRLLAENIWHRKLWLMGSFIGALGGSDLHLDLRLRGDEARFAAGTARRRTIVSWQERPRIGYQIYSISYDYPRLFNGISKEKAVRLGHRTYTNLPTQQQYAENPALHVGELYNEFEVWARDAVTRGGEEHITLLKLSD